jgi:hypothetical protein
MKFTNRNTNMRLWIFADISFNLPHYEPLKEPIKSIDGDHILVQQEKFYKRLDRKRNRLRSLQCPMP